MSVVTFTASRIIDPAFICFRFSFAEKCEDAERETIGTAPMLLARIERDRALATIPLRYWRKSLAHLSDLDKRASLCSLMPGFSEKVHRPLSDTFIQKSSNRIQIVVSHCGHCMMWQEELIEDAAVCELARAIRGAVQNIGIELGNELPVAELESWSTLRKN